MASSRLAANIKQRPVGSANRTPLHEPAYDTLERAGPYGLGNTAPHTRRPTPPPTPPLGAPGLGVPGLAASRWERRTGSRSDQERDDAPATLRRGSAEDGGEGPSPLILAAKEGRTSQVAAILRSYAQLSGTAHSLAVDCRTHHGETPLVLAGWAGHEAIARSLLDAQARPDLVACDGNTALSCAAYRGHVGVVALLLEHGAATEVGDLLTAKTALVKAAYAGHAEVVMLLADRPSACLDSADGQGYTALAFACAFGTVEHAACVDALLRARAEPNVADDYGVTPLMHAAARSHVGLVQALLQARALRRMWAHGPRHTAVGARP